MEAFLKKGFRTAEPSTSGVAEKVRERKKAPAPWVEK